MTFNISHAAEQKQRIQADLAAVEEQIEQETNWYYLGVWDGKLNNPPNLVSLNDQSYWAGYTDGLKQYWNKFVPENNQPREVF